MDILNAETLARYVELYDIIKSATAEMEELKAALKSEMRPRIGKALGSKKIDVDGFSVSVNAFEKTFIDTGKLRKEHPEIAEALEGVRVEVRVSVKAPRQRAELGQAA